MTPHPLYKWKSFWLGILVLVFLGWASYRSKPNASSLQYKKIGLESYANFFAVTNADYCYYLRVDPAVPLNEEYRNLPWEWFPAPYLLKSPPHGWGENDDTARAGTREQFDREWILSQYEQNVWILAIPYWLLMLAVVVPWSAFLAWRWRIMKRLTKVEPNP